MRCDALCLKLRLIRCNLKWRGVQHKMADLKLCCLNVRGLNNHIKRKRLFQECWKSKYNVIMLQETYITSATAHLWQNEWGGRLYFNEGDSNARGVCTLVKNNLSITSQVDFVDREGRILGVKLVMADGSQVMVCNIYAPNNDNPEFFKSVMMFMENCNCEHWIMGGDWNLILDKDMDSYNRKTNNNKSAKFLHEYMQANELTDAWRAMHPDMRRYTHHKRKPVCCSRLDFYLITSSLINNVTDSSIQTSTYSDHNMITLNVQFSEEKRGPGVWRLNVSLLGDEALHGKVDEKLKYCYTLKNLDIFEKWEFAKSELAHMFKAAGKKRKKQLDQDIENYKLALEIMEQEMTSKTNEDRAASSYEALFDRVQTLEEEIAKGAIVRSRAKWYSEGERCSKYFFALEKRNYCAKTVKQLNIKGTICTERKQILREMCDFYKDLYTLDVYSPFTLENNTNITVKREDKVLLDRPISIGEIRDAIMDMHNDKAPGLDGLPVEFYKAHVNTLLPILLELYNEAYKRGKLNPSARQGLISLLPKGNKDSLLLKNWRPLTLLNLDYKILAKMMASRIKNVLDYIIGPQQTGFMCNRQISENIRKTMDVIAYANQNRNSRWLIISIDFEKCFDRCTYSGIFGALSYFGFGDTFTNWCKLFFSNFQSCTQNDGFQSQFFTKTRSINQGCPISPYLFLLLGEIMTHKLYENGDIKGITINGMKLLVSQFADDTVIFINFDSKELQGVIDVFEHIERQLGLKISYDKTTIYRIGSLRNTDAMLYCTKKLNWSDGDIDLLGITVKNSSDARTNGEAYNVSIDKMEVVAKLWSVRHLTLMGRVLIVNTLMASILVYKMAVLPELNSAQIKRLENITQKFIWKKKRSKIRMGMLKRLKKRGGLQLVDYVCKNESMRLQWIKKLRLNPSFQYVYEWLLPSLGQLIWKANLSKVDAQMLIKTDSFWKQITCTWCDRHFQKTEMVNSRLGVINQLIWGNSNIRVENTVIIAERAIEEGLLYISDLINEEGEIASYEWLLDQYGPCLTRWKYCQIVSAIPQMWKRLIRGVIPDGDYCDPLLIEDDIVECKKPVRYIYNALRTNVGLSECNIYYNKFLEFSENYYSIKEYYSVFKYLYEFTKVTKYRDFQYRFLLNRIYPNHMLYKWNLKETPKCDYCTCRDQTTKHLFWECPTTNQIVGFVQKVTQENLTWADWVTCYARRSPRNQVTSYLILLAKFYIYQCKCGGKTPSIQGVRCLVEQTYMTERYVLTVNDKNTKMFIERWTPFMEKIENMAHK